MDPLSKLFDPGVLCFGSHLRRELDGEETALLQPLWDTKRIQIYVIISGFLTIFMI